MKAFGAKVEKKAEEPSEILVFPENEDAVRVFLSMSTQWNVGGMGSIIGLNYSALEVVLKLLDIKDRADCFQRVRVMESEALLILREQERRDGSTTKT